MNETVKSYCEEAGLVFTRCRPYRKNDQAWVEQKNGAVVRRAGGFRRYAGLEHSANETMERENQTVEGPGQLIVVDFMRKMGCVRKCEVRHEHIHVARLLDQIAGRPGRRQIAPIGDDRCTRFREGRYDIWPHELVAIGNNDTLPGESRGSRL